MRDLCSSANKVNSLGKPTNRWLNIYANKMLLGDGNDDSNILLIADIGNPTNPTIRYNVTTNQWEFSNNGSEYNAFGSGSEEYVLPTASSTVLGGIKVGTGLTITGDVLSAVGGSSDVDSQNRILKNQLCFGEVGQVVFFTYYVVPPTKQSVYFSEFDTTDVIDNPFSLLRTRTICYNDTPGTINTYSLENKTFELTNGNTYTYDQDTEFVLFGDINTTAEGFFTDVDRPNTVHIYYNDDFVCSVYSAAF